jgi:branched-chain amino acid transport system permease protein
MIYLSHLLIYLNIYVIVALGLNIIVGYCGRLTLSQAGYFAIGSYAYALASVEWHWGFLLSTALGAALAGGLSLAISLPSWRLKGDFFVMVSLAVQVVLLSAIYNWYSPEAPLGTLRNVTNGPAGISGIPKPDIFGIKFDTISSLAILATITAGICLLIGALLLKSPWGRVLQAMRDDELAAKGLGKNVRLLKLQAFAIACALLAVGGALHASYVSFIDPSVASLDQSVLMLCMVVIGGIGNFRGPLVGAFILLAIPEALRFLNIPIVLATELRLMAYGLLLVLMMHFRPQGLCGSYRVE